MYNLKKDITYLIEAKALPLGIRVNLRLKYVLKYI